MVALAAEARHEVVGRDPVAAPQYSGMLLTSKKKDVPGWPSSGRCTSSAPPAGRSSWAHESTSSLPPSSVAFTV